MIVVANSRIKDYVLCHLGEVAADANEITDDIRELIMHPSRNPKSEQNEQRLEYCRKLSRELLEYVAQGLKDLRAFEASTDNV